MEDLTKRTTQEVLEHHIKYLHAGDLEGTLLDYADNAILVNMGGPKEGLDEIRAFFKDSIANCLPAETTYEDVTTYVHKEVAYIIWKADSPFCTIPYGTDTFIVKDGKIVWQSFAGIIDWKK